MRTLCISRFFLFRTLKFYQPNPWPQTPQLIDARYACIPRPVLFSYYLLMLLFSMVWFILPLFCQTTQITAFLLLWRAIFASFFFNLHANPPPCSSRWIVFFLSFSFLQPFILHLTCLPAFVGAFNLNRQQIYFTHLKVLRLSFLSPVSFAPFPGSCKLHIFWMWLYLHKLKS